jgi:hypothetical protein
MKRFSLFLMTAGLAAAEVVVPDGTKLRVRLDQTITSATAEQGQAVELTVTEPVKVGDQIVIAEGARVTGTITTAQEKRHMGRAGKLDFSIDRVRAIDNEWVPLRYTVNKASGGSHAVSTGVLTAGAAVLFWPAAPAFLLIKGKDVTVNKGVVFDTFTDSDHALTNVVPPAGRANATVASSGPAAGAPSSVAVASNAQGADIEVDGAFVGSTPTTLSLAPGLHQISVRSGAAVWQRSLQVSPGSTINLNAQMDGQILAARKTR